MRSSRHERYILKVILEEGEKTSLDFEGIANTNQYFCNLVHEGILKSRWGLKGNTRVKYRSIADLHKAKQFLGIPAHQPDR